MTLPAQAIVERLNGDTVDDRFWSKVEVRGPKECWPWTCSDDSHGRGIFWLNGRNQRAPRVAWSLRYGVPFPEELHACHTCDNPSCCNPAHIWPGTPSQNSLDASRKGRLYVAECTPMGAINRAKTFCKRGHQFTQENTYITPAGSRSCRACMRMRRKEHEIRKRAHAALANEESGR